MTTEPNQTLLEEEDIDHNCRIFEVNRKLQKTKKEYYLLKRHNLEVNDDPLSPLQEQNCIATDYMSFEDIVNGINSGEESKEMTATHAARKILTRECEPPIDILINANVVPKLVEFLSRVNNPDLQLESVRALTKIVTGTSDQTQAVVRAGAVDGFMSLLGSSHPVVAEIAVRALGNIAGEGPELKKHITEQGVIKALLTMIKPDTSVSLLREVTWTLVQLVRNWGCPLSINTVRPLVPVLAHLLHNDDKEIVASVCLALSFLAERSSGCCYILIQAMFDAGVVPRLVALLVSNEDEVVFTQSLRILKAITYPLSVEVMAEASVSSIPGFIFLLGSPNPVVTDIAVHVLGFILDCEKKGSDLIEQGILKPLLSLIKPDASVESLSGVAWTLSRLCHKTLPSVLIVRQILPALVQLIHNDDYEIYDPACLCLTKLTNDFENDLEIRYERIQEVVDAGFVPRLVALLNPNKVSFNALETICNIVSGNDAQTDSVLAAGVCPLLAKLLVNTGTYIIEYAARTVSEIAAGNETQIQALVTNNVIRPLVDVLSNVDFERQKQAARAITNIACGGNVEQIALLYEFGAIAPLCTYILETKEPKTIVVELDGLANILAAAEKMGECAKVSLHVKECGLLDRIGVLLRDDDIKIHPKSLAILERYFSTNGDEDSKFMYIAE